MDSEHQYWSVVSTCDIYNPNDSSSSIGSGFNFNDFVWCHNGFRFHHNISSYLSKGDAPEGTKYGYIFMISDGADLFNGGTGDSSVNRLMEQNCGIGSTGRTWCTLKAYNNTAGASDFAELAIINDHGTAWAVAPTPASTDEDSTKIATTEWVRDATGTFACYCKGLNRKGATLGPNYEMTTSDFSGAAFSSNHCDFKADTTSAPIHNDGDFEVVRFYAGSDNYAQFFCASPRRSALYFGHFWNGTWDGWSRIFNDRSHVRFTGDANTVHRADDTGAVYICGGTSIDDSSAIQLIGKSASSGSGHFNISARSSTTNGKRLNGTPSGTLQWNGQNIQVSSDERLKTPLSNVPDSILDAWGDVEWGQFQYLEAVKEKGENARLHLGMIAQKVKKAFEDKGLDACEYGILCHEERPEVNEEKKIVDCREYTDEDGVFHPEEYHVEKHHEDAVDLWMVRYAEAQAMEAAYNRREVKRLKERLARLEEQLAK